jgi:general secretion pathway protein B
MSYILDALRRADSERERDRQSAPGLHSQSHALAGESEDEASPAATPWSKIALGLSAGLLMGAAAWWLLVPSPGANAVAPSIAVAGNPPIAPNLPAVSVPPGTEVASPASGTAPTQQGASAPILVPMPALLPEPKKPPDRDKPVPPQSSIRPQVPGSADASKPAPKKTPPPASTPPAAGRVSPLRDLPEPLRRDLPPLAVTGSMFSPQADARMIVLDGQVYREGQSVRPGLVVETIGPKAVTLSFKGERFELNF